MTSEQRRFFDSYTEPLDVLADTAPEDRFRGFDTDRKAVLFHGEPYELGPVLEAVEGLQRKAEAEMRKPRFDTEARLGGVSARPRTSQEISAAGGAARPHCVL